jgi:hypothetical protein
MRLKQRDGESVSLRIRGMVASAVALFVVYGCSPAPATTTDSVRITKPEDGASVDARDLVEGRAGGGRPIVWIIVQTPQRECWAQGPAFVEKEGQFSLLAQFGEIDSHGARFIVRALINPKKPLSEGRVSCNLPAADVSGPVTVKRR